MGKPKAKAKKKAAGLGPRASRKQAKAKPKPAKPKKRSGRSPKPEARSPKPGRSPKLEARNPTASAVPEPIAVETSSKRRARTAREIAQRSLPVVAILDDPHPIGALRRFLEGVHGPMTEQQAQIALGAAQLILFPIRREERGSPDVCDVVDMIVERWPDFGVRRSGFHAQEFLRNALAAIGVDRKRIGKLESCVPDNASSELLFELACAHAIARDKVAMLRAVERTLEAGTSTDQFRRDLDFAPYASDPDLAALLAHAEVTPIPVEIDPYLEKVRAALDSLVGAVREYGETVELRPPVRLDAILDAERARKISLPNDYRALLTITNGMRVWDYEFFGVGDYREATALSVRAQRYLATAGIASTVPLASWGSPHEWLLFDLRGHRYVLGDRWLPDLAAALARIETAAHEQLGTN